MVKDLDWIYNSQGRVRRQREPERRRADYYPLRIQRIPIPGHGEVRYSSGLYSIGHDHDPDEFRAACAAVAPGIDFALCTEPLETWWRPIPDGYHGFRRATDRDDDAVPVTFLLRDDVPPV